MDLFPPESDDSSQSRKAAASEQALLLLRTQLEEEIAARLTAEEGLRETLAAMIKHQQVGRCGNFRYNTVTGQITGTEEVFKIFDFPTGTRECTVEEWLVKLHPDHRPIVEQQFNEALAAGDDLRFEYSIVLGDGTIKHIRCDGEIDLGHPSERSYFGVLTDITERRIADETRRTMEADLATALRLASLGELAGSIVHEVNQPLAAIATSASACRRWLASGEQGIERALASLDRIVEEGARAAAIVSGLKSLIRNVASDPVPFDLNAAVREICSMMMRELARDRILVETDFGTDVPLASGNRVQIQQVLVNLVKNASEAMRQVDGRRVISISTRREDAHIVLGVSDTGLGLPEDAEHIFAPLYTTKKDGLGLGLSISRRIAMAHGGSLQVRQAEGGGAQFILHLPLDAQVDHG